MTVRKQQIQCLTRVFASMGQCMTIKQHIACTPVELAWMFVGIKIAIALFN